MGRLKELIEKAQFKDAADPVELWRGEQGRRERNWSRKHEEQLKVEAWAKKEEAAKKAALKKSLEGLLILVGARQQLEDMRRIWRGKIDRRPVEIPDANTQVVQFDQDTISGLPPLPAMGLALRYRFRDAEEADVEFYGAKRDGSYWSRRELFLLALVGFREKGIPYVASLYGSRISLNSPSDAYYISRNKADEGYLKWDPNDCLGYQGSEEIFPDDPDKSEQVLVGQFLKISEQAPSFRILEAEACERITADRHLPHKAWCEISPFWQQRLAGRIPVVNWFLC